MDGWVRGVTVRIPNRTQQGVYCYLPYLGVVLRMNSSSREQNWLGLPGTLSSLSACVPTGPLITPLVRRFSL